MSTEILNFVKTYNKEEWDQNHTKGPKLKFEIKSSKADPILIRIEKVVRPFLMTYLNAWYDLNFAKPFTEKEANSLEKGFEASISSLLTNFKNYKVSVEYVAIEPPSDYYNIIIYNEN